MTYYMTQHKRDVANYIWMTTSAVGAAACFLILFITFAIWLHPKSRAHLDRVSWRIVVWALAANFIFAIASVASSRLPQSSETLCGFSVFVLQIALQFSGSLFFTISLNLQLVVIHGFSGQKFEKFYIAGSAAIAIILNVPPYATGKFGWDPMEGNCWYTLDSSKEDKLVWQIATQMIWTALTAFGEIINSACVIIWMWRYNRRVRHVTQQLSSKNSSESDQSDHVHETNSQRSFTPINYKGIFVRISRYPLASCFVNLLSIFTALHSTMINDYGSQTDYNILLLSDFLYGGRPVVYATLAALDPAFIRGFKTLLDHLLSRNRSDQDPRSGLSDSEIKPRPLGFKLTPMANDVPESNHNVFALDTMAQIESKIIHHNRSSPVSENKTKRAPDDEFSKGTSMKNSGVDNTASSSIILVERKSMDVLDISFLQSKSHGQEALQCQSRVLDNVSKLDIEKGVGASVVNSNTANGRDFTNLFRDDKERQEEDAFWKQI
ncbi:hypothetical protein K435DRAFT_859049 [Dendrothele bispora CBS 962.96]|uniref:G-protein coupled receptors family 2 profile 2 domain-containing protein n=1 Tax=Dendrothele bispora (strain CBS 962.96) TaxID=1314807 RepID=A0A4V4HFR5_DENBC|nr:hypothetical protein K435DRAFT_859049 [Dendrothele bispora CBS 962.96]